jgi:hypothetical protein
MRLAALTLVLVSAFLLASRSEARAQEPAPAAQLRPPAAAAPVPASILQLRGAGGFGMLLGWYVYYINRYRKTDVQIGDLTTLIGVLGGGAVLALYPSGSDLFGAYGLGLAVGFFGYFFVLVVLVAVSKNFDADWFLDGRRKDPTPGTSIPGTAAATSHAMTPQFAHAPGVSVPPLAGVTIQPGSHVTIQVASGDKKPEPATSG